MANLLLIHGGLWEEGMDAVRFWRQPGIVAGLERRGFGVFAPDRLYQAPDWTTEASHLAQAIPDAPVTVLAGSNGGSAAARLAVDFLGTVTCLLLAWPATAGDPGIDTKDRAHLTRLGATPEVIDALLIGQTLRGLTDGELASLTLPSACSDQRPRTRSTSGRPQTRSFACYRRPQNCLAAPSRRARNSRLTWNHSWTR